MPTHRFPAITILVIGLALAAVLPAYARKMPGCAAGRFVVTEGGSPLAGPAHPGVLVVDGETLTVEGACPASGTARRRRTGTKLAAAWDRCGTAKKVRLRATARDCGAIRGRLHVRKRAAAFVAMPSTCGDGLVDRGAGEQCDGAATCADGAACASCRCAGAQPLDCERDGYPCSFAQVPLDVVTRSLALSADAAGRLDGGASPDDVGAFLRSQPDMADVTVDDPVVAFRLAGGRPMIVDVAGAQRLLPGAAAPSVARAGFSPSVVVGDGPRKRGLVLSPFRYEPDFGTAGDEIAAALRTVRGYEDGVTYLATLDELSPQVTIDTLTRLDDYDVVHLDTHGGTLCKETLSGIAPNATGGTCEHGVTDFLVQRFHGTAADLRSIAHPGVVHYRGRLHESIAVTADFFRHYYPQGLRDTVFVLASCNTFRPDMASAIAGTDGVYLSWDAFVDHTLVRSAGLSLVESFGLGMTVGQALDAMPPFSPTHPGAEGSRLRRTPRASGGDLRLRELPRLLDPATGDTLVSGASLEIVGATEDGDPDRVQLILDVDGIPESEPHHGISVAVDGTVVASGPIAAFASPNGPWSWRGEPEVDLGFDVTDGQPAEIVVTVSLPEGGTSAFAVSPTLAGPRFEAGRLWQGTFTYWRSGLTLRTIAVTALFERDPGDGPTATHPTFRLTSGTMTWSLSDNAGDCIYTAPTTVSTLVEDAGSAFTFDLTDQPVTYRGKGESAGPLVDLVRDCPDLPTGPVTSSTEAGGRWFNAPIEEGFVAVSDASISGEFSSGFGNPDLWTWSLVKIE